MTANYLAIFAAGVAAFVFGGLWYSLLGKQWSAAHGWAPAEKSTMPIAPMIISFVAVLVMAFVLAGVLAHVAKDNITIKAGLITGVICWFGFVLTTLVTNHAYGKAKPLLTVIDAGHWLGVLMLQGLLLGWLG